MAIASQIELLTYRELWKAQRANKVDVMKSRVPKMNTRQLRLVQDMQEPQTPTPVQKTADDVQYKVVQEIDINMNDCFGNLFGSSSQKIGSTTLAQITKSELSKSVSDPEPNENQTLYSIFPI